MELIMNKKNAVCIKLTKNEMQEMGFTYENLNSDGIMLVNRKITAELGITITKNGEPTLIEAFPDTKGDCLLFLLNENFYRCSSQNLDNICLYSKKLRNVSIESSKLLKKGKEYHLLISLPNPSERDEFIMSEFCEINDEKQTTKTECKTIIDSNAVQILSNLI